MHLCLCLFFLRDHGLTTGFYTSPDLTCLYERIQIDDQSTTEDLLQILQQLALVALYMITQENVEAAIFEILMAELRHNMLFESWHKAGILKIGALHSRSRFSHCSLKFSAHRINCSLTLSLSKAFLDRRAFPGHCMTSDDISRGIENFPWPGIFEVIGDGKIQWLVDGAHNELRVKCVAEWFANNAQHTHSSIWSYFETAQRSSSTGAIGPVLKEKGVLPDRVIFTGTANELSQPRMRLSMQK